MGVLVKEERQSLENQGPNLLGCPMPMDLLGCSIFFSNEITKSFTAKGLVET